MPLFSSREAAEDYKGIYDEYCRLLRLVGLTLPQDETRIICHENRPVVLYILQKQLPPGKFVHKLIHTLEVEQVSSIMERILNKIKDIWEYNRVNQSQFELALDGQLSNWVLPEDDTLYYIDTSTPLFRKNGKEQLNPELILQSAPSFLRWVIRWLFLKDVMNRYYDERQVSIDLVANLYKEQRPDLVPMAIGIVNNKLSEGIQPISVDEVEQYYKEDKFIWTLFLAFRRLDRWMKRKILRQRYEFILPGKIKR